MKKFKVRNGSYLSRLQIYYMAKLWPKPRDLFLCSIFYAFLSVTDVIHSQYKSAKEIPRGQNQRTIN